MTTKKIDVPTLVQAQPTTASTFAEIKAKLHAYGQGIGSKYDKLKLDYLIDRLNPLSGFIDVETKVTKDGREFDVINFCNPDDVKDKLSLPISGDSGAQYFELWDSIANCSFSVNGNVTAKGTKKVRCYSRD